MSAERPPDGDDRRRARRVADLVDGVDLVLAALLLAGCAGVYWLTTRFEVVASLFAQDVPPEFLPRLLIGVIALLALMLPFEHLLKPGGRAHFAAARSERVRPMAWFTAALLVVVVAAVQWLGTLGAIIAVCFALPLLWGERRWRLLIPYALIFPTVVVFLFARALGVYFEPGLLGIDFR